MRPVRKDRPYVRRAHPFGWAIKGKGLLITVAAWVLAGVALWLTRSVLDMFGDARQSTRVAMLPSVPELAGLIVLALIIAAGVAVMVRRWPDRRSLGGGGTGPHVRQRAPCAAAAHGTEERMGPTSDGAGAPADRADTRLQIALPLFGLAVLALPYLPWLPDWVLPLRALPGPITILVWFVVIGQMIMASLSLRAAHLRKPASPYTTRMLGTVAIFLATFAAAGTAEWLLRDSRVYPSGDEPHYLIMMQSLWRDHDLKIQNNYERQDYDEYLSSSLELDVTSRGRDGQIYPVQPVGLAVLGAPVFAWRGYHGVIWMLVLLTALTATLMWRWTLAYTGSGEAATVAWASIFLGAPLVLTSVAIYPDIPAAFCVMVALAWRSTPTRELPAASYQLPAASSSLLTGSWKLETGSWFTRELPAASFQPPVASSSFLTGSWKLETGSWFIRGLAVSALPWLSMTYAPMSAALAVMVGLQAGAHRKAVMVLLSLFTVSLGCWLAFFYIVWGQPSPMAPFGSPLETGNPLIGALGLLFDQEFGLLVYAPALALGLVGTWRMAAAHDELTRRRGREIAILFISLAISVGALQMWWGGAAPPGRPLVPVLPALGLPIAWAYRRASEASSVRRAAYQLLMLVGMAVSSAMLFVDDGALIAQEGDGSSRMLEWLSDLWPAWVVAPSLAAFGLRHATPLIALWIAAAALIAWLCGRAAIRSVGAAALLATAFVSAGLIAVALIAPALVQPPLEWVLQPESRSRVPILDNFDAVARPHALIYNPFTFVRASSIPPLMTLAAFPGQRPSGQPVRVLLNARYALPAGEYEVEIGGAKNTHPVRGYLALQVGRKGSPMRQWEVELAPGAVWRSTFALPVDAEFVGFIAKPPLDTVTSLRIRPVRIADKSRREAIFHGGDPLGVLSAIESPAASVFFHDEEVYPEAAGVWIRGESTALMTIAPRLPEHGVTLRVHSGTKPNTIEFVTSTWRERVELVPGEPHEVHIPAPPTPGPFVLSVTTDTGFVPADVIPGSTDRRVLGGWIEIAN